MKKCITKLLIFVTLISCFGVIPSYANESDNIISAYLNTLNGYSDKEGGTVRYIVYDIDKNGIPELIIESGVASASVLNFYTFDGDVKWIGSKEGAHVSLASVPNKNGILRTSAHSSFQHVSLISIKDNKIEETEIFAEMLTPEEYNEHGYYEPNYFFDGAEDLNFCEKSDLSALKKIKDVVSSGTSQTISTVDFDLGMAKGIQYFNNGQYYEAMDEFQWFCDANWGRMNDGQQQYVLGYLNNAKEKVAEIEKENSRLTQQQFDNGMRKGIDYFNKGMYYEARDEFQWFCDANWGKMNDGQRKYALDYLDGAKREIQNLSTQDNGTWYHSGTYAISGGIGYWQYSLSISNITSDSLTVNYFGMSQSSLEVKGARLYRQNDGSYAGSAITTDKENIYLKINIISNSHIKLTYGYGYYSEIIHFYK